MRFADCHSTKKHYAKGLCERCYNDLPHSRAGRRQSEKRRAWSRQGIELTREQYHAKLELQGGLCAICGQPPPGVTPLAPDHNHATGQVRELLCIKCNTALGLLDHNSRRCIRAAKYIASYERDGFLGTEQE